MPLTPTQIAGAVNYFTQSGNSIAATQQKILAPPAAAPKAVAAVKTAAAAPSGAAATNPALAHAQGTLEGTQALNPFDWLTNPLLSAAETKFAHDNGSGSKSSSVLQDMTVPEGKDEAPKNATQWILNALSTGDYASGRFLNQIGVNEAKQSALEQKTGNPNDPVRAEGGPLQYLGNLAGDVGNDFAGGARGVAEGVGARFNNQAPITPGKDLATSGGEAGIKSTVKAVGGDAGWQNWTAGAAGTAADVALDPTTYIGGVGLVKGVKEGVAASVDALKTGSRLDDALMAGGAAFSKGAAAGKAAAAEGKLTAADLAAPKVSLETQLATEAAARAAATDLPVTVESVAKDAAVAAKEPALIPEAGTPEGTVEGTKNTPIIELPSDGAGKLTAPVVTEHPAMAGIRDLLPQLSTVGRSVDAGKILSDARVPIAGATIAPEIASTATSVLHEAKTVPEITAGLKSLKATPEGKSFLATPLKAEGAPPTVGAALERGAMARVTGGSASGDIATQAVDAHLATSGAPAAKTTAATLDASIAANEPEIQPGEVGTTALIGQLAAVKTQPARQRIVANLLNLPQKKFQSFDQAIKAATSGQVEASAMRSMLNALGINTRASKPDTLIGLLNGKGAMNWADIQKGVPTAQEVLDTHGVSAEQADAAKLVDVPAERAGANAEAVATTESFTLTQQNLFKLAMERGHSDGTLTPIDPAYVETYNKKLYNTLQQPVLAAAAKIANNIADPVARATFMYDHVMPVLEAADKALLSEGRVARLVSSDGTAFYGTLSDVSKLLQRDTVESALFGLDYRLTPAGQGYIDGLPSAVFKQGLTIYPTSIGFGAKAAREGKNVFAVAQAMIDDSGSNVFAKSPEGKALINQIAAELTTPENVAALTELDTTNRVLAVANAQKAATDFVNPRASAIIAGAAGGGDRAETIVPAMQAAKDVANMKKADDDPSLVQDMSAQRLHNGTVQTLGEEGTALARSDARQADATPKQQMEKQAASNAKPVRRTKMGEKIPAKIPAKGKVADSQKGAEALSKLRDDSNDRINTDAVSLIEDGTHPDTVTGHIDAQMDAEMGIGFGLDAAKLEQPSVISMQVGHAADVLNEAFNGLAGEGSMEGTGGVRQAWINGVKSMNHEYGTALYSWNSQLPTRLAQAIDMVSVPSADDVTAKIKIWLNALQAHGAAALAKGQILGDDDLTVALAAPIDAAAADGLHKTAAALDSSEIPFALELQHHIDQIAPRGGVGGAYSRMGANPVDVAHQLATYKQAGDEFDIDPTNDLAAQQSSWQLWNAAEMPDPLNTLFRWHQAIMASSVDPGIGQSAARLFGHDGIQGLSRSDALAKGWRPIDPEHATGLFQYIPKDTLFPPELHGQLAATQRHLTQMQAIGTVDGSKLLAHYDRALGVLKDSMTAWNPSHSVTNILSDAGMNLIHGVDPGWTYMGLRAQFAGGQLDKDPDLIIEAAHNSTFTDAAAAQKSASKYLKPTLTVTIKNGKQGTVGVEWTPAQLHESAMRNGIDATLHQVADKIDPGTQGDTTGLWDRLARAKYNPVGQINKKLNQWGVIRDNVPRYTQYIHALQSRSFRSIDEAEHYAAGQVHLAHPLPSAMSKFERTTVRRLVTFYSWQRLALGRVLELALEKPGLVTLPSKYQYEQAQAAGFDPESIGKPFGNDPRIASYESNGIFGPTFSGGYSPLGGTADLAGGEDHQWGFSVSSPAMDALSSAFQGATIGTPAEMLQNTTEQIGSNVSPLLAAPAEIILNSNPGGIGAPPDSNIGQFLLNQTGAPGRIAKAAGLEPKTLAGGVPANSPAQQAGENSRQALNYLTGLKFTDYTNDTSAAYATKEQAAAAKNAPAQAITKAQVAQWVLAGYTPQQIKQLQATK